MTNTTSSQHEQTKVMLLELGIPVHLIGYQELRVAVPLFAQNRLQSVTKELYPAVAKQIGGTSCHGIERSIRKAIYDAWGGRNPEIWECYFPNFKDTPSNKQFIAVLAERLQ